jgi:hypothetical protein
MENMYERELIREHTSEGCMRTMAAGVKFCHKPKLSPYERAEAVGRPGVGKNLGC